MYPFSITFNYYLGFWVKVSLSTINLLHMLSNSKGSPFFFGVFFIQGERNQQTLEVCVGPTEPINTNV